MAIRTYQGMTPALGERVFVDRSAVVLGDVQLGEVLGVPFHASRMQLSYLGDAQLTLDVRSGCLGTMSLEDADGLHFVLRSRKLSAAELADLSPVR